MLKVTLHRWFYLKECKGEAHTNKNLKDVRICITTKTLKVSGKVIVECTNEQRDPITTLHKVDEANLVSFFDHISIFDPNRHRFNLVSE